jgi:hypothetical protein
LVQSVLHQLDQVPVRVLDEADPPDQIPEGFVVAFGGVFGPDGASDEFLAGLGAGRLEDGDVEAFESGHASLEVGDGETQLDQAELGVVGGVGDGFLGVLQKKSVDVSGKISTW